MDKNRLKNILLREFPIYYISRIVSILPNHGITCNIRGKIVSHFLGKCGIGFQLAQGAIINYPENMIVGNNVYIAHRAYVNATSGLQIGDNVTIGPNCIIATSNHSLQDGRVSAKDVGAGGIAIGSGTWIGGNVTLTAGISIGERCIIGAGSVVTRNIENGYMAAGVPAKKVKTVV